MSFEKCESGQNAFHDEEAFDLGEGFGGVGDVAEGSEYLDE